jgi:hypothetical protein
MNALTHHEMKVWKSYLSELYYLVTKNQGFHVCEHENPTVGAGKIEAKVHKNKH